MRAFYLLLTLPFFLSFANLSHAKTVDSFGAPEFSVFQTESTGETTTGETTTEGSEEEEEPDC